ncbi:MAG: MerR family transcriptional regulator, partial [Ilumatobacteraceae bacterium]
MSAWFNVLVDDDAESTAGTFGLAELAVASGVSARTIRYYQAERLLPPPAKRGRQAVYGPD